MAKDKELFYLATTSTFTSEVFERILFRIPDHELYQHIKSSNIKELWSNGNEEKRNIFLNYLYSKDDSFLINLRFQVNRQYNTRFNKYYTINLMYKMNLEIHSFVTKTLFTRAMVERLSVIPVTAENTFVKI